MRSWALVAFLAVGCVSPPQDTAKGHPPPPKASREEWTPPAPNPKDHDWIQLKSGEWLKGDIKVLREDKLEFDSKEMDDLKIDWEDVKELRSPRMNTVVFEDHLTAIGTVIVHGDQVIVSNKEKGTRHFKKSELLAIVPGEPKEANYWSGKMSIGFTGRSGNTNQTDLSSSVNVIRRSAYSKVVFDYLGAFGKLEGEENVNNHRITGRWDIFVSKRWYVTPFALNIYRDPFQNIGLQVTPSAGGGYHIINRKKLTWDLDLGFGYRFTRFESVGANQDEEETTASLIPSTRFEWDITKKTEFGLFYRVDIGIPDTANTNQHLEATFTVDVIGNLDLDIRFVWDRIGNPQRGADGNLPEQDDFRIMFGLGWDF